MLKRTCDILGSILGLVVMSPLLALIAVAIRIGSPGPVLFRQDRLGLDGRRFRIYKFRSMVVDAEWRGARFTVGGDSRITPVGRFLRRHKLDELPQLINVLSGEMSLVGPRPEVPEFAELYPSEFAQMLRIKPGITHRATLCFRNEEELLAASTDPTRAYIDKIMPAKMQLYIDSMPHQSVRADILTIVATVLRYGETFTPEDLDIDTPKIAKIPVSRIEERVLAPSARETVA